MNHSTLDYLNPKPSYIDKLIVDRLILKLIKYLKDRRKIRLREFYSLLSNLRIEKEMWLLFIRALEARTLVNIKISRGILYFDWNSRSIKTNENLKTLTERR